MSERRIENTASHALKSTGMAVATPGMLLLFAGSAPAFAWSPGLPAALRFCYPAIL